MNGIDIETSSKRAVGIDGTVTGTSSHPGWHGMARCSRAGDRVTPFVIVEGPEAAFDIAVREISARGWTPQPGFGAPFRSGTIARTGLVDGADAAGLALLAALEGQGLVVRATTTRDVLDRLIDDLRRLGPVDHRIGMPDQPADLGPDARAILGLLAEGHTLGQAADLVGLSRRTADRRLAEARRALGVRRTTEAIALARRLGWLGADRLPGG
jgi:DNA-binding CsgD family transcriptional regulator